MKRPMTEAFGYARRGKPIFPLHWPKGDKCSCGNLKCPSPAKHPLTEHGLLDATTDLKEIQEWWKKWPEANIGLVTGKLSDFIVIDVDPRHGGENSIEEIEMLHGALPATKEVLTGGGGRHIFFSHPGGNIKSAANVLGPGVDIRADKAYVVAPPSRHMSGRNYEWEVSSHEVPFAKVPDWLLKLLTKNEAVPSGEVAGTIQEGSRNATLTSLAGSMRRRGMSKNSILAALLEENQVKCTKPLPESEVKGIVNSVGRYPPTEKPAQPSNQSNKAKVQPLPLVALRDLLAEPDEIADFLVEDLLPTGGLSLLVAKPKTGKSTVSRQLALAVARGEDFLGRETKKGLSVYLALEERRADVRRHFRQMGATGEENLKIFSGIAPQDCMAQLRKVAEDEKPALIIVDTLVRLTRIKDMNDYALVTVGLEPLLALAREVGAHVMLLHHGKKGDSKGIDSALGSTALSGSVDSIIYLRRTEAYRTIASIQRVGEDIPETVLDFDKESQITTLGGTREEAEVERFKDAILEFLGSQEEPAQEKIILDAVEGKNARKKKALRDLVFENRVQKSGEGKRGNPFLYEVRKDSSTLVPHHIPGTRVPETKTELTPQNGGGNSGTHDFRKWDESQGSGVPESVTQLALEVFPGAKVDRQ